MRSKRSFKSIDQSNQGNVFMLRLKIENTCNKVHSQESLNNYKKKKKKSKKENF